MPLNRRANETSLWPSRCSNPISRASSSSRAARSATSIDVDAERLLIVATDRLSAFDVVLPDPIPGKGVVLTSISNFWFKKLENVVPNHLTGIEPETVLTDARDHATVKNRAVVVQQARSRCRSKPSCAAT